jgi:hypothetical protein
LKRREEMGKEQLDRTKRFTDDGKLRGIISSAKFVPECTDETEYVGFGQLFKAKGRTNEEIDRELDIVDEKVVKKRKVENTASRSLDVGCGDISGPKRPLDSETKNHIRSEIVVLKMPPPGQDGDSSVGTAKKQRRVQFAGDA